jgi:hypothetical protein
MASSWIAVRSFARKVRWTECRVAADTNSHNCARCPANSVPVSPHIVTVDLTDSLLCDILAYLHAVSIRGTNYRTTQPIEARHCHSTVLSRLSLSACLSAVRPAVCTALCQYHRALCDSLTPSAGFVASFRPSVLRSVWLAFEVPSGFCVNRTCSTNSLSVCIPQCRKHDWPSNQISSRLIWCFWIPVRGQESPAL